MVDLKDVLVNSCSDGSLHVKTFVTPKNKVYYVVNVGYFDMRLKEWKNQMFTIVDGEVAALMSLFRSSLLFPKKSYSEYLKKVDSVLP